MHYEQCHTEDRSVNHHSCWLMLKIEPLGARGQLRPEPLVAGRRANNFGISTPPKLYASPITIKRYQMYVFSCRLSTVPLLPVQSLLQ
jgi:hypothetical protein